MISSNVPLLPDEPVRHLYVHVPFCPTICPFCSFHVLERRAATVDAYLVRLDVELASLAERCDIVPDTVYLGGGTPSYLRPAELERVRDLVERRVGWARVEATLEVHPSTASRDKVARWAELGFGRLSVGAQSFDDAVLATLGRPHDGDAGRRTTEWCLATGATTSVDVMTAIDGQDLAADLRVAIDLGVDHVSAYTLTIEPDTPFERQGVTVPDEAAATAIELTAATLTSAGFERYEVSNYARPGARCRHNEAYWTGAWFAGIGPSASGFLPRADGVAVRTRNADTVGWLEGEVADVDVVDGRERWGDAVLCGLRLVDGVDLDALSARAGYDARPELAAELRRLEAEGLIELDGPWLRSTEAGRMVLDGVAATLL